MGSPVTRVELTLLQIPFKETFRIPGGAALAKEAILVAIESADGTVGMGECSISPTPDTPACDRADACWDDLYRLLGPAVLGQTFDDPEAIARVASSWPSCSRHAVAGIEMACWDLLGHQRHASLAEMLGVSDAVVEAGVESGLAMGLYPTIVDLLRAIEPHLEEGYRRLKLKIQPGQDVELVQAVRQHFGADLDLMVDGEGTYTVEHLDLFRKLDEFDLLMIEQPLPADDLAGLATIQQAITTPICLDESADSLERAGRALAIGAGRIVNLKHQRLGGIGATLAMHNYCAERGVACWIGALPELGLGLAAGLHLAALPNCKYPTDIEPSARWFVDDYVTPLLELGEAGRFRVPTRAGLGAQADPVKVRRYQLRHEVIEAS